LLAYKLKYTDIHASVCRVCYLLVVSSVMVRYRIVLSMLIGAYDTLLRESGSEARCPLSSMDRGAYVMPWNTLSPPEAEITVIFCICVLAEIGNSKNNIIGVCFFLRLL